MIINDIREKSKHRLFIAGSTVFVVIGLVGGVKLWSLEEQKMPVAIEYKTIHAAVVQSAQASAIKPEKSTVLPVSPNEPQSGMIYEGSRGGRTYYPAGCTAAKRISAKNRIWFESAAEALRLGYTLSKLCGGASSKTKLNK